MGTECQTLRVQRRFRAGGNPRFHFLLIRGELGGYDVATSRPNHSPSLLCGAAGDGHVPTCGFRAS
jgi:hypothetical protein